MLAFNYNPLTFQFTHSEFIQESPLEPGKYLLPAHATLKEPLPEKEGYAVVWEQSEWIYKKDLRGRTVWKNYDQSMVIKDLGDVPDGWYLQRPEKTYTLQDFIEMVYREKCKTAYTGLQVIQGQNSYIFQTDKNSISMASSTLAMITNGTSDQSIFWKVWKDDQPHLLQLSQQQFRDIFSAGMRMINNAFLLQASVNQDYKGKTQKELQELNFESEQQRVHALFETVSKVFVLET